MLDAAPKLTPSPVPEPRGNCGLAYNNVSKLPTAVGNAEATGGFGAISNVM